MKVTINVECTPEEARAFMGLPDVAPLQEEMLDRMRAQMDSAAQAMDPEQVMKAVFPFGTGSEGFADMQKAFWSALTSGMAQTTDMSSKGPSSSGGGKKKK